MGKMQPSSAVQVGKESSSDMAGPVSRTGWWMWVKLVKAGLGVILGVIAFFVFTFVYGNIAAGAWALISAMFAGLVLHLHIVYKHRRLELYYSAYSHMIGAVWSFMTMKWSFGLAYFSHKYRARLQGEREYNT